MTLRCDNEPVLVQVLRMTVNARLSMGLPTRASSPMVYSHSNSLVENVVGRARALAGSLMFALSEKVGVTFSSKSAWWSWALRHACWILNRFSSTRAVTPYELAYGREYTGALCQFGEPIFGYHRTAAKSSARWKRAIFLGKIDPQDSYLLYDGQNWVLTRSVRRISTSWKGHLVFYMNFTCWSWNYEPGFGGKVVPTKEQRAALGASFNEPQGHIEPSAFFDEEAEQVRQKFLEEQKEEEEAAEMLLRDKPAVGNLEVEQKPAALTFGETVVVDDDEQPRTPPITMQEEKRSFFDVRPAAAPSTAATSSAAASSAMHMSGLDVPTTPRTAPTTRVHGAEMEEEHESKKARVQDVKTQRIERIVAEHEKAIRAVKVSEEKIFHTLDDYETDLQMDDHNEIDLWAGDDEVATTGMPEAPWCDADVKQHPPEPDSWVDRLADEVELQRLCSVGVLVRAGEEAQLVTDKLTTKFVYDWRLKTFVDGNGVERKRWLRRPRLVAREYAFPERRSDTCSPATSTHILNLLPLVYLQKCGERDVEIQADSMEVTLACLDVKDGFLMVLQDKPVKIKVGQEEFLVKRSFARPTHGNQELALVFEGFHGEGTAV